MENQILHHNQGGTTKLIRAPNLKRGRQDERITERIKLEKVFGITLNNNSALATDPNTGVIAYPAGCTVVLYNPITRHQSHIINTSKKCITALAFSSCGRYVATGESGHQPAVRVWDLLPEPLPIGSHTGHYPKIVQVGEFVGHKFGVSCVAFSPTSKVVVSVGTQHDQIVNVWDWKNNVKLASNKVSATVKAIAFAENGSYFVTVGNRLVKFWYLDCGRNKYNKEAVPLMGRSAILGEQRNNNFVDVACGRADCGDNTYAITRSGLLCEFNNRRLLDKWVELRTTKANSLSVGEQYIFVGCEGGIVRCFDPKTLQFVTTLPRTHYLGVDVSLGLNITHMSSQPPNAKYPDAVALSYDAVNHKVTCIYNDHSIYVWDVRNIYKVGKSDSFLFHSACIWGVEMAPVNSPLPNGSFLTCSSDDTIRVWTLDRFSEKSFKGMYIRNIYSKELLKVVYVDPEMAYLKDRGTVQDKQESTYDSINGVRAIRLSPDGKKLASGDRTGNIRIHETTNMSETLKIEAHDAEVLCLEFSGEDSSGHKLMASASRDRLIHVFDVKRDFNFLQTLDDHSSSITSVRFLNSQHGNLQMISCGADKSLIFRSLAGTPNGTPQFQRSHNATGKNTLYDMEIDVGEKHVLTACQDRNVRIYSVSTGKHTKSYKGSSGDDGSLIKVVLDKSGMYLATSSTDKSLSVYDYYTGECMATMCGHSELATGLRFTNDCKRIISTSGDGCIFVWKVPHDMVVTMHARLNQQAMLSGKKLDAEMFSEASDSDDDFLNTTITKKFSIGKLPLWAKKQMTNDFTPPEQTTEKNFVQPKGRWAERAATDSAKTLYSYLSDVDSSLESDRDQSSNKKKQKLNTSEISFEEQQITEIEIETDLNTTLGIDITNTSSINFVRGDPDLESTAHDADVDSDQEYRQQPLYPSTIDSASGSEFTVNQIDVDELRKSVRRSKRASLPPLHLSLTPTSQTPNNQQTSMSTGTGSQESDDDDDEASTPSGENTDVNPMSMLSTSMESLYASREKYLQSTYESLSGNEMDLPAGNKTSISALHHTRTPKLRNVAVVNAAKQTKNDVETTKKREHLNKMIADTRKKLQSIGYVSPLKASQSICDLSHVPEKETRKDRLRSTGNNSTASSCSSSPPTSNANDLNRTNNLITNNQLNKNDTLDMNLLSSTSSSSCDPSAFPSSQSVPNDLQLCGCYMREIQRNLNYPQPRSLNIPSATSLSASSTKLSDILSKSPEKHEQSLAAWIQPRKMQLDRTLHNLHKNKMYKSLPVSPVSEETKTFDFDPGDIERQEKRTKARASRKSFSYFIELDKAEDKVDVASVASNPEYNFKQICDDIEKFSQDFSRNYQAIEDIFNGDGDNELFVNSGSGFQSKKTSQWLKSQNDNANDNEKRPNENENDNGNFSSDSLEDCSFNSMRPCQKKKHKPPRRCVSNNELSNMAAQQDDDYSKYLKDQMPKSQSQSFYLNQSAYNSQESILSSEDNLLERRSRSFCNSMESILSNESDCKSAPLECLFRDCDSMRRSKSCNYTLDAAYGCPAYQKQSKTVQTQTDFETPEEVVVKKSKSTEFQQRLLKFEQPTATSVAYFLDASPPVSTVKHRPAGKMEIPSLQTKNAQYVKQSKYCNVLNNKPEYNAERQMLGNPQFTLTTQNLPTLPSATHKKTNKNKLQETASLDRHLLAKGLLDTEKICHKPPKAVRRHSSKTRRRSSSTRTTYEYVKKEDLNKLNNENSPPATANTTTTTTTTTMTSIEFCYKENNTEKDLDDHCVQSATGSGLRGSQVQNALKNIKILNEIQEKIGAINNLVELFKTSLAIGKVRALSSMYDHLNSNRNTFISPAKRNVSLPDFFDISKFGPHDQRNINIKSEFDRNDKNEDKFNIQLASMPMSKSMNVDGNEVVGTENEVQRSGSNALDIGKEIEAKMDRRLHTDTLSNSMRRACSLSDLSHQGPLSDNNKSSNNKRQEVSGKLGGGVLKNPQLARLNSRYTNKGLPMARSSSTGVLNQSDSDDGGGSNGGSNPSLHVDKHSSQSRLMRPTISSQNKVANSKNSLRKRHSTLNLASLAQEDSSSEELEPLPPPPITKPIVPPRTRLPPPANSDLKLLKSSFNNNSNHALNNSQANRAKWIKPDGGGDDPSQGPQCQGNSTVQESNKLCNDVAMKLTTTASEVVKLYGSLTNPNEADDISDVQRNDMVKTLQLSIVTTQKLLHDLSLQILKQDRTNVDVNQTDSVKEELKDLIEKGFPTDESSIVNIMQQYSDILLGMMQQKIQDSNK